MSIPLLANENLTMCFYIVGILSLLLEMYDNHSDDNYPRNPVVRGKMKFEPMPNFHNVF